MKNAPQFAARGTALAARLVHLPVCNPVVARYAANRCLALLEFLLREGNTELLMREVSGSTQV